MEPNVLSDQLIRIYDSNMLYYIKNIAADEISYFSSRLIDISSINLFEFGEKFTNYHIEHDMMQSYERRGYLPHALIHYAQSRKI